MCSHQAIPSWISFFRFYFRWRSNNCLNIPEPGFMKKGMKNCSTNLFAAYKINKYKVSEVKKNAVQILIAKYVFNKRCIYAEHTPEWNYLRVWKYSISAMKFWVKNFNLRIFFTLVTRSVTPTPQTWRPPAEGWSLPTALRLVAARRGCTLFGAKTWRVTRRAAVTHRLGKMELGRISPTAGLELKHATECLNLLKNIHFKPMTLRSVATALDKIKMLHYIHLAVI